MVSKGEHKSVSTRNHSYSTRQGEQKASELAMASARRVSKANNSQRAPFSTRPQLAKANGRRATRNGEWIYSRGELGRPKLLKSDMAKTHWWRNLNSPRQMKLFARRVDADQKIYKSPLDPFIEWSLEFHIFFCNSFREREREREREIGLVLHRVREFEGGFFLFCWEITKL